MKKHLTPVFDEYKYILISLKPKYYRWILDGYKKFEFRSRFPYTKTRCFIYVTKPVGAIKACIDFDKPIIDHNKLIGHEGQGVNDFISGKKGNKMAIPIIRIIELNHEIPLSKMREYNVFAPQSYVYLDKNSSFYNLLCGEIEADID